jgi:hypothetical protein
VPPVPPDTTMAFRSRESSRHSSLEGAALALACSAGRYLPTHVVADERPLHSAPHEVGELDAQKPPAGGDGNRNLMAAFPRTWQD